MAAKNQDIGNSLGFHLLSHMEGENSDSDQEGERFYGQNTRQAGP